VGKGIERAMKLRDLRHDDGVNRQIWRMETGNRWISGKQTDREMER